MSDIYDPLLDRLTRRLKIDPELACEVRRELRTHLEEAQHDFVQGGQGDIESCQQAMRALGDETVLEEELWSANRGRVRMRRWLRRGLLAAMLPLALLATLWPMWERKPWQSPGSVSEIAASDNPQGSPRMLARWVANTEVLLKGLPPDQRFLFLGDPSATTPQEKVRSIRDRWPNDPVYQAYYIRYLPAINIYKYSTNNDPPATAPTTEQENELLGELIRGQTIDPDNAFWPMMRASVLASQSAKIKQNDPSLVFRTIERDREKERSNAQSGLAFKEERTTFSSYEIINNTLYQEALVAFEEAVAAPNYDSYAIEMLNRQFAVLPPPRSLSDLTARYGWGVGVLLTELGRHRQIAVFVAGHAIQRAQSGDVQAGLKQLDKLEHLTMKIGSRAQTVIELLVAVSLESLISSHRAAIYQIAGDEAQVQASFRHRRKLMELLEKVRIDKPSEDELKRAATWMAITMPAVGGYKPDPEPLRTAEQAMTQQLFIVAMLLIFDGVILLLMLAGLWVLWRQRKAQERPPMLWIGWRRLSWVLVLGVLLPVGMYVAYLVSPWSQRDYGVHAIWLRMTLEHGLLLLTVLALVMLLSRRALFTRAKEIGLVVRRGVLVRGLAPILTAVVVLVSVIGYSSSSWVERQAISRASGAAALDIRYEVSASGYRVIRERMAEQTRR